MNLSDVSAAVDLLHSWNGKLTWEKFQDTLEREVGVRFSKTALTNRAEIQDAYSKAKARLREGGTPRHGDVTLIKALARIEKLKAQVDALNQQNIVLLEQFRRWHYNARRKGLTDAELEMPLPKKRG